jgi:class 3 adenylate cyclase/tetratricopeptide (TPR) repeat protein
MLPPAQSPSGVEPEKRVKSADGPGAERKVVTALFSDLTGFTALTGRLDPEDVREITGTIFQEIRQVAARYDGLIEKFAGDGALVFFGVPRAHEDDPVRALRAAREIHEAVAAISPRYESRLGHPLTMHSGINTGLAVTADVDLEKGAHGVTGEAINIASRLSDLAKAGQILVGAKAMQASQGYFSFRDLGQQQVKGKSESIPVFELLEPKGRPETRHRISGLRAELTGRNDQMVRLNEAADRLRKGLGSVIAVCGDPGTGKSRLIQEFRDSLDRKTLNWLEGHCFAYSQNISYFPLIDFMNRAWQIAEHDSLEKIRNRIEPFLEGLPDFDRALIPFIGSLYALSYPQIAQVSPEFWKSRFSEAIEALVASLARRMPTVFCFEDIHWADQATLDLLRSILTETRHPAIFLCVYRLPFSFFPDLQSTGGDSSYDEIRLQDLSLNDARQMLCSLLKAETIPEGLCAAILAKTEGNPFYLEEVTNSLLETEILVQENGRLNLTRPLAESDIPSTVQGVISARLDRLSREMKLILQEASVIGRTFAYDIVKRISRLRDHIDGCLQGLERIDIIRAMANFPELEYMFKHALTQEVVYAGLLRKERQEIHERIGLVMEQLFQDRLPEFYETLAYHFKRGRSEIKAVHYLMRSGEKSLNRYAVDQSHQYYQEAFDLLSARQERIDSDDRLLIEMLLDWAYVFYYRGDWLGLEALFEKHEALVDSLKDQSLRGMFYAWLGFSIFFRGKYPEARNHLNTALSIGEATGDLRVIGYACTWLMWPCMELGPIDDAIAYGQRAMEIAKSLPSDQYLFFKSVSGTAWCTSFKGDGREGSKLGKACISYGLDHGNIRSQNMGYSMLAMAAFSSGEVGAAIEYASKALEIIVDPFYKRTTKMSLAVVYAAAGEYSRAEEGLLECLEACDVTGDHWGKIMGQLALALTTIAKGELREGMRLLTEGCRHCRNNNRHWWYILYECCLGNVYLQIVQGGGDLSLSSIVKNIGFLIQNVPLASRRAEGHFNKAIAAAEAFGAIGLLGQAYLGLSRLHKAKKRKTTSREYFSKAIDCFERCEANTVLTQTREELRSL